jgi:hypothetical protein
MARGPDASAIGLRGNGCDTAEPPRPAGQRPNADDDADIRSEGSVQEERQLKEKIRKLAQDGLVEELCAAVEELSLLVRATEREKYEAATGPRSDGEQRVLNAIEDLAKRMTRIEAPSPVLPRTWASVASSPPSGGSGNSAWVARKVVPARHAREVVIRTKGNMAPQPPAEVVSKINTALRCSDALAVRRLPSGDAAVTFAGDASAYARDLEWVREVFGPQAEVARRTYAVIAKAVPRSLVERRPEDELKQTIREVNYITVARCKAKLPREGDRPYGSLILEVEEVTDAQSLCERGLVVDAQIFNCEPYSGELQVTQCFKCHAYGHKARTCTKKEKCGFCGDPQHNGGDPACPRRKDRAPKCINCKGPHPAWDRSCRVALAEKQRIKDAYEHRPRQFVVAGSDGSWPSSSGTAMSSVSRPGWRTGVSFSAAPVVFQSAPGRDARETDEDGFTPVPGSPKKRKRGRPTNISRPEAGNGNIARALSQGLQSQPRPRTTSPALRAGSVTSTQGL